MGRVVGHWLSGKTTRGGVEQERKDGSVRGQLGRKCHALSPAPQPRRRPLGLLGELSTSGYQVKQLVVQANLDGRLEVFAINLGDEVVHSYETSPGSDSWNGWSDFQFGKPEGKAVVQVSATIDASGRVNVVALADDTVPYRNVQEDPNGGWTGWYRDTPGSSASAHPAFHGHSQKLCHTLPRPKLVAKAVGKKAAETDPAAFKEYMVELKETCDKMCRLRVIPRSSSLSMTPGGIGNGWGSRFFC